MLTCCFRLEVMTMVVSKMSTLRQNYFKLLALLVLMVTAVKLMSVSFYHKPILSVEAGTRENQAYVTKKQELEFVRMFSKENVRMFVDVLEKLSSFLNKTNPVVNIRLEMKTDGNDEKPQIEEHQIHITSSGKLTTMPRKLDLDETDDTDMSLPKKAFSFGKSRTLESKDYEEVEDGDKRESHQNQTWKSKDSFLVALSNNDKQLLYDAANYFATICGKMNITYLIYGGTLLGSWRHHDIIPWDDDIDFHVNIKDRDELYSALNLDSTFFRVISAGPRLKLFSIQGTKTSKYPWLWPYVDIHFYRENDTHIKDCAKEFAKYVYEKSIIFPTHVRPLGPLYLSSPRDSYATLRKTYKGHKCETYSYSHRLEKLRKVKKRIVSCKVFKDQVAFVHRRKARISGIEETLKLEESVIQTVIVPEPDYAITDPYSLDLLQ